jgi:hypothetical protein
VVPVRFPSATSIFLTEESVQRLPGQYGLQTTRSAPAIFRGVRGVAYDVFVPKEARGCVGCLFYLKDKDGLWFQARAPAPLAAGRWNTVVADLRGGSPDVQPLGHLGRWDENQASQVQVLGLTFYGDRAFSGELRVDNLRGWLRGDRFVREVAVLAREGLEEQKLQAFQAQVRRIEAEAPPALSILDLRTEPAAADGAPRVGLYRTLTLRFSLDQQSGNPFDPEQAEVRAAVRTPSGRAVTVNGFWHQEFQETADFAGEELKPLGAAEWRVRFTPRELGEHTLTLSVSLLQGRSAAESAPLRFIAVPSGEKGFVRVSRQDPYFFEYETGEFLYLLGHNVHSPIDLRCWDRVFHQEHPPNRGLNLYRDLFPKMAAAGENVAEVWMSSWWLGIEWTRRWRTYRGKGRYSLENAWRLDKVLELARRHGLKVHLVIDNHGKFSEWCDEEWDFNPYNRFSDPDGPVRGAAEFFRSETARKLHRQRLRYILARWASDPAILGWELVSEYDLVGDGGQKRAFYTTPVARTWSSEMLTFLRESDPYGHPVTNHFASDFSKVDMEQAATPLFDYIVTDAYREEPNYSSRARMNMDFFAGQYKVRKPYWITEFGGNWNATSMPRLEADLHSGLWSTWMTNAAGTPLFWWYDFVDRGPPKRNDRRGLYDHYRALANFIHGEDRRGLEDRGGETREVSFGASDGGLSGMEYAWRDGAYVWVYDETAMCEAPEPNARPKHSKVETRLAGLAPGKYLVEFWDTYSGCIVKTEEGAVAEGAELPLRFPDFRSDMAAKVKPLPRPPPPAAPATHSVPRSVSTPPPRSADPPPDFPPR